MAAFLCEVTGLLNFRKNKEYGHAHAHKRKQTQNPQLKFKHDKHNLCMAPHDNWPEPISWVYENKLTSHLANSDFRGGNQTFSVTTGASGMSPTEQFVPKKLKQPLFSFYTTKNQ